MGARVTCVHATPIPPLRLNKIMAWRLPGNPLSFFQDLPGKKRMGSPQQPPGNNFMQPLCGRTLSCVDTLVHILAPLHTPMDIRLLPSHVHGVTPVL